MTTITALPDSEETSPSISFHPSHTIADINPLIYGGFTEHMGRCIYGGIYDPDNAHGLVDKNGFRADVIESLKELQVPVIRYPGGNFVATYRWQDGIGPRHLRPKRPELAWLGTETNQFGTDEFMQWLDVLSEGREERVEPYLCLNMGTGTLKDALAWVEYCNGDRDTYWANKRRENGRQEPWGVKYWALGNEVWGPWQVEQNTKEDYGKKAVQWAKALKLLDPTITLILCGRDGISDWDRHVLQTCLPTGTIDMHSIHFYSEGPTHMSNVSSPYSAERAIQITSSLIDLARCELDLAKFDDFTASSTKPRGKKGKEGRMTICFDEWNVWSPSRAPGEQGAEEKYTLSDALAVAVWLNIFIRNAKELGMATIAQSVNVISPLMTTPQGIVKQTTYWPLLLFSKYMRGKTVAAHVRTGVYEGETQPEWLQSTVTVPWLDVSVARHGEWVNLSVVNVHEGRAFETQIGGAPDGGEVEVYMVGGERCSLTDVNEEGRETVGIKERKDTWNGKGGKWTFEKASFTLLRWKIAA